MNILILTDEYYPHHIGGAGVVASQIAKGLNSKNINCTVKCSNPKNIFSRKFYNVVWPVWSLLVFAASLLKKNDMIIVNDLRSAYVLGIIGSSRLFNKSVYIIHGTEIDVVFKSRSKKNSLIFLHFYYARFLRQCKKIVYVSNYVASRTKNEFFVHGISPQNEVVSYAGLSDNMHNLARRSILLDAEGDPIIRLVSFSRLESRKGYIEMVSIFETMLKSGINLVWDIYGQGSLESDIASVIELKGLEDRIHLLGRIDRNFISNHINPDVYDAYWLLPIEPEAFGLTYIESAAVGLPAIGPKKYGITEAISENESGFFYENPERLLNDLIYIKSNKKKMMVSCKDWALKFNVDNFIDDILD